MFDHTGNTTKGTMATTLDDASTDSDDSDVAFANLNFDGVDFGCGEEDDGAGADAADDTPAAEEGVPPLDADCTGDIGEGEHVDCEEAAEDPPGGGASMPIESADVPARADAPQSTVPAAGQTDATTAERCLSSVTFSSRTVHLSEAERRLLEAERDRLLPFPSDSDPLVDEETTAEDDDACLAEAREMFRLLEDGRYADVLRSPFAARVFGERVDLTLYEGEEGASMTDRIRTRLLRSFEDQGSYIVR